MNSDDFVEIGRLQKPHGIKGEITANIDADIDVTRLSYIITVIDGLDVPFFISSLRPRNTESVLLSLEGIDNERDAAELSLLPIKVRRSDIEHITESDIDDEDNGMSASDLITYTLIDDADHNNPITIGTINAINEITADNWLFEINTPDGHMVMVPIVDDLITEIDTDHKTVTMTLPAGLTDL